MLQVLMGIGIYFAVALPIAIMIGKRLKAEGERLDERARNAGAL